MNATICFEAVSNLLQDRYVFPTFQTALAITIIYGIIKEYGWLRQKGSVTLSVKRGKESWNYFHLMYALLVVVIVEVNNTAEALKNYKTIITLADLTGLFYLCFFNSWFRNRTLSVINASLNKEEK
jgi:hypothetical protein